VKKYIFLRLGDEMKKILRNKKGMTLIEVIISISVLAIFLVPITVGFQNALLISKLSENQLEINNVSRLIREEVVYSMLNNTPLFRYNPADTSVNNFVGRETNQDQIYNLLDEVKATTSVSKSPQLAALSWTEEKYFRKYYFIVTYDQATFETKYPETYSVKIDIFRKDDFKDNMVIVNTISATVDTGKMDVPNPDTTSLNTPNP
jgi:prepilin-type N-terminal cleavage/methylation domain-containing protein